MMRPPPHYLLFAFLVALLTQAGPAYSQAAPQTLPRWTRVSFFAQAATSTQSVGGSSTFTDLVTTVAAESARREDGGLQYGFDMRLGAYPSSDDRPQRVSIYDAYVAQRLAGGRLLVKAGQMWLNDLGALGSVGGGLVEARQAPGGKGLRWRAGGFGGMESKILDVGYVAGIKKFGGYVALDNGGSRKHVLGYVNVRNRNLTERSVLTFTNYVPVQQSLFLYQAAEVDLSGPAGQGNGGLTYFFVNARVSPAKRADVQVTYHRGRSIDARSITDDILHGRPVPAKTVDGYLFESIGTRVTLELFKGFRVFGGYGQDRNDRDSTPSGRMTFGVFSSNLLGTGLDLNVSDYRYDRGSSSSSDSWYVSVGRSAGSRVYLSGEFSSSLSVLRFTQSNGIVIENKPATRRFGGTSLIHLSRTLSLLGTFEHTTGDSYRENRLMTGLTYRF